MNKHKSAVLIGVAIGDSLGKFAETKNWNAPAILAWDGHSYLASEWHQLSANQYTDDTCMSLCLANSLLQLGPLSERNQTKQIGDFDPALVAAHYLEWYDGPNFRGAGKTTRKALQSLKEGAPWYFSGELGALGNGAAMRASPLGVWFKDEPTKMMKAAKLDAIITHNSFEAQQGSVAMTTGVSLLLNGVKKEDVLEGVRRVLEPSRLLDNLTVIQSNYDRNLDRKGGNRIISQLILGAGYTCIEAVAGAFYCFLATKSFDECVELAIRGGSDSDTRASMTCAFAGAYYGLEGIPNNFVEPLENRDIILELDERLSAER